MAALKYNREEVLAWMEETGRGPRAASTRWGVPRTTADRWWKAVHPEIRPAAYKKLRQEKDQDQARAQRAPVPLIGIPSVDEARPEVLGLMRLSAVRLVRVAAGVTGDGEIYPWLDVKDAKDAIAALKDLVQWGPSIVSFLQQTDPGADEEDHGSIQLGTPEGEARALGLLLQLPVGILQRALDVKRTRDHYPEGEEE